jgi:O-antigen/teichoic acid export membrane protein
MIIKIMVLAISFGVSVFLGRTLGADGLGIIQLMNSLVMIIMMIVFFGFESAIIKNVSIGVDAKNSLRTGNVLKTSYVFNGALAIAFIVIGSLATSYFCNVFLEEPELETPLYLMLFVLLPLTISDIYSALLKGHKKIWQDSALNELLPIFSIALGILLFYLFDIEINVISIAALYAFSKIVKFLFSWMYVRKLFSFKGKTKFVFKPMLNMAIPLLLVTGSGIVISNIDKLMIGWLKDSADTGLYSVALRLSMFMAFFLQVSNAAIGPKLASMYKKKEIGDINTMVKRVTLALILVSVVFFLGFFLFGDFLLGIWGEEFKAAYVTLLVLAIGQLINTSTGCAGVLLIMCGEEKLHGKISIASLILNLVLNYIFIINYGILGAAIATSITIAVENIVKVIYAKTRLGILTIPTFR